MGIESVVEKLLQARLSLPKAQYLPDDKLIAEYEQELGVEFSGDYKYFLKTASDSMFAGKSCLRLTPTRDHTHDLSKEVVRAREVGLPEELLPFCEDNGNYYCFDSDGKVVYWSHDGTDRESWPNLGSWITEVWLGKENA